MRSSSKNQLKSMADIMYDYMLEKKGPVTPKVLAEHVRAIRTDSVSKDFRATIRSIVQTNKKFIRTSPGFYYIKE